MSFTCIFYYKRVHNKDSKINLIKPINASNKLKVYDGPELEIKQCKSKYIMRKNMLLSIVNISLKSIKKIIIWNII